MNNITQKIEYKKSVIKFAKRRSVAEAVKEFKESKSTIYRWINRYNGTNESLMYLSRRPKSHPNQHTEEEIKLIKNYKSKNKTMGLVMFWLKLRSNGYKRSITSLYRVMIRLGIYKKTPSKKKKYEKYNYTPAKYPGEKIQIDVKFVPKDCMLTSEKEKYGNYYQYTAIDEYTRQRVVMATKEHNTYESTKFLEYVLKKFKYPVERVQTDNGFEFTNRLIGNAKRDTKTMFEKKLISLGIEHKLIKPRTPKQNGKVERSHRKDQENLYYKQKFLDFDDFKEKLYRWNRKYNNTGMQPLGWKSPNKYYEEYMLVNAEKF